MIGSAGRWIVPLLLEAQRATYPHIALRITEGTNSVIEPQLVNGQLDIAVLAWPVLAPELTEIDLFSENLVLIVDRQHPLAQQTSVTFATLANYELLLPFPGTPIRREIDDSAHAQGIELRPVIELDGLRTIASMTFDGHGPSILPATMLSAHLQERFVAVPIEHIAQRRVSLVSRRFGFPAAPVRAIHALLIDVVKSAVNAPAGVFIAPYGPSGKIDAVTEPTREEVARLIVRRDKSFRDVVRLAGPPPARRNAPVEERFSSWCVQSSPNSSPPRPRTRFTNA